MICIPKWVPRPWEPLPDNWKLRCVYSHHIADGDIVTMPRNQEELELRKTVISKEIKKTRQCRIYPSQFDRWIKKTQSEFCIPRGEHPIKIDYTETIPAKTGVVLNAIDKKGNETLVEFNPLGIAHPRCPTYFSIDPIKTRSSEYWNSGEVIEAYKEIRAKKVHTTVSDLWEFLYYMP